MDDPSFFQLTALLLLIGAANSAPIAAKKLLGRRFTWPVDGHLHLRDGHPLFGASKTVRGVVVGVLTPALLAPVLGMSWWQGSVVGAAAMTGDLLSSFTKRRLKLAPSGQALGLDQIPEALLPALAASAWLDLGLWSVLLLVAAFTGLSLTMSKVLYRYNLRDRPY